MTKLIVAFREYAKVPKNVVHFYDKPTNAHYKYKGAEKSLARPGRKQATATEDFDVRISCL
jgi:hypothetical protein